MKKLLIALGVVYLAMRARARARVATGSAWSERGIASWYGPGYAGNKTANGEIFDPREVSAAHKTLPFGTRVEVTDLETGKVITVRINDRGPYVKGRIIDLSERAAEILGIKQKGLAKVELRVVG